MMSNEKNKKQKETKSTKKDDLDRIEQSFLSNNSEETKNKVQEQFDDLKKLASDFSLDSGSEDDFSSEVSEDESYSEVLMERLSDIETVNPFISDHDELKDSQDKEKIISEDLNHEMIAEQSKSETSLPFLSSPLEPKKIDELNPQIPVKKKLKSLDDIQNEVEELTDLNKGNEEFLEKMKSVLDQDQSIQHSSLPEDESKVFTTVDSEVDDRKLFQELENEISKAEQTKNPFIEEPDFIDSDGFLENLEKITIPEVELDKNSHELDQLEDLVESELMLSSSSWKDLLDSTDDGSNFEGQKVFQFDENQSLDDLLNDDTLAQANEKSTFPLLSDENIDHPFSTNDFEQQDMLPEGTSDDVDSDDESVDNLRKSFIDEFDQSAFDAEIEKKTKKKWLPRNWEAFSHWFKSLTIAEKILIFLSFFIGLAVVVSIVLVISQWSINNRKIANPPPAIQATEQDLIYPTGLQLPGGWFFFLERGEIQNNKWEPQNAEWLANTKLRRVIAIPWSSQSETVVQSLTTSDEISIFMNNNDIVIYQVDEVVKISRDNVRILSDTEPSLVVILFREDNEDRWTVIAKPKQLDQ